MKIILSIILTLSSSFLKQANEPEKVISDFYEWYIKDGYKALYSPDFVESPNGMTKLDFNEIDSILVAFNFSDNFIKNYKNRYQECRENLSKTTYEEYLNFDDIDQLDNIGCLIQGYFWFKDSWEHHETFKVRTRSTPSKDKTIVTVILGYKDNDEYELILEYTLVKREHKWIIDKINNAA